MGTLINIGRFPVGVVASAFLVLVLAVGSTDETILLTPFFVWAALKTQRQWLKESWIGSYPNVWKFVREALGQLWTWVLDPDQGGDSLIE